MKISDAPPFLKQPPLFYQPLPFKGKIWIPSIFGKFQKLRTPFINGGRGRGLQLCITQLIVVLEKDWHILRQTLKKISLVANRTYTKTLQSSKIIPRLLVQIFFYAIYKYFKKFYEVIKLAWKKLLYCCWGKWFTQSSSLMGKYFFKLNNKRHKSIVHGHCFSVFIVYFELVFSQIFIWSPTIS